jgi:hypothetical protein
MMPVMGLGGRVAARVMVGESREPERERSSDEPAPEDLPNEPGGEGGSKSPAADTPPALPSEDDSELGDTDQHSTG